jgi:DNA invertase Pin-like site-specific DNA recombinase
LAKADFAEVRPPTRELRAWCAAAGHAVSREYIDFESGRKGADKRKQFATLFDDAAKRKFDCVLFWALDRFSREGMAQTIIHLQRLSSYGVAFHSYAEPHLATDNELVRNILVAPFALALDMPALVRSLIFCASTLASDVKIGRPKLPAELRHEITRRAAKGETAYAIAKALHIDRHTAAKYLQP